MTRGIDYGNLMHKAMRGLIREVLEDVATRGLPGQHHFFITFDTTHPDAELADWLSDRYPEEMTIVLQHWFDALTVDDEGFSVVLNFGDSPEPLYIPFDALRTFVDPSVEFGLRFETASAREGEAEGESEEGRDGPNGPAPGAPRSRSRPRSGSGAEPRSGPPPGQRNAEVVSLDKFRK